MSIATEYVVRTRYEVDPKSAEAALARVQKSADAAGKSVNGLKAMVVGAVGAVAGFGLIGKLGSAFVGFNSNVEQAKIQMAGLFELNKGGAWNANMALSSNLVDRLAIRMKDAVGTTSDAVSMAGMLVQPLSAANASMKQIEDSTVGAVVASKAFGIEAGQAALDLQQALNGTLGNKDRFAAAILGPMGFTPEKFNKLTAGKRLETVTKALNSRAIQEMAKAQGESFSGVMSTMEDNIEQTLGKVGKPLFVAITNEVKQWSAWFDKNPEKVKEIAESVSKALVSAFSAVKAGMEWVYANRDTLMMLAKVALLAKVGGAIGSTIGGIAGKLGGVGDSPLLKTFAELSMKVGENGQKVSSAFQGIAAAAGPLLMALGLGMGIGDAIVDSIHRRRAADRANTGAYGPLAQAASEVAAGKHTTQQALDLTRHAFKMGLLNTNGGRLGVDQSKLAAAYGRADEYRAHDNPLIKGPASGPFMSYFDIKYTKSIDEAAAETRMLRLATESLGASFRDAAAMQYAIGAMAIIAKTDAIVQKAIASAKPNLKPGNTIINNLTVEMSAKDPDRWIEGFNRTVARVARVRTRARAAMRGGGT